MKHRLFWKIWLGFWVTLLLLGSGLWLFWSLRSPPYYPEWDPPRAVANAQIESAATALQNGGRGGLAVQVASWPGAHRARLTVSPIAEDRCAPLADPRMLAKSVETPSGGYCLRYATPPLPVDDDWTGLLMPPDLLIATTLAGLAFSAALAWYVASPIRRLQRAFDRLAGGELDVRFAHSIGSRKDEVADLARAFDRMAERLQELVGARDRLLHDVSHELRSPLARMRLATGLLRRDPERLAVSLDRIDREADHLDALVGELLTLAKLESGAQGVAAEYFDLLDVLRLVLQDLQFEAASAGVQVAADLPDGDDEGAWLINGSGVLAHRAVENILRNALRFSDGGQTIYVKLEERPGLRCAILVEDEGPGIADAGAADLLKPFVQDTAAGGSGFGLGLAIAQRAVATCGGSVELVNRSPSGLKVTIDLPLARALGPS